MCELDLKIEGFDGKEMFRKILNSVPFMPDYPADYHLGKHDMTFVVGDIYLRNVEDRKTAKVQLNLVYDEREGIFVEGHPIYENHRTQQVKGEKDEQKHEEFISDVIDCPPRDIHLKSGGHNRNWLEKFKSETYETLRGKGYDIDFMQAYFKGVKDAGYFGELHLFNWESRGPELTLKTRQHNFVDIQLDAMEKWFDSLRG